MDYLFAFIAGGSICALAQILIDLTKLTPARILTGCVVTGVILSGIGIYKPFSDAVGAGASVPLTGFGHLMAEGVKEAVEKEGALGIITGGITAAAAGITAAILLGLAASILGKSRLK